MEFDKNGILNRAKAAQQTAVVMDEGLRAYMLKVYNYMATGILLTGIVALLTFKMSVVTNDAGSIVGLTSVGNAIYMSGLKWLVMLAPLGIVFYMSFGINKMSASKAQTTFWVFAGLMGFVVIVNFISLHWHECNKSFLYMFSNFRSNEHLWLHN
jgi:FtsH-binding integral membrane protein